MRVISRARLNQFAEQHPDVKGPLDTWFHVVEKSHYATSHEMKATFSTVSFLGNNKAVCNIGGNKYRLVVHVRYDIQCVFVLDVLTHAEYDNRIRDGTL